MEVNRLAEQLVSWIKEQVQMAGCQGTIFGLSGGVDSAVAAALCQRAFPRNALGVIMPCHSQPEDKEHAEALAVRFSMQTREVVLDGIYDSLRKMLPVFDTAPAHRRLTEGNLKARLRMVTLYYIANQLGYMVVGSGNRSELFIGYFTKYGDGGADILPLGNLVKSRVLELAAFLGIPGTIIDKAPSAGLWEGQTDEGDMGFSYEVLDNYLLTNDAPEPVKSRIEYMAAASRHKRSLPPIAPL